MFVLVNAIYWLYTVTSVWAASGQAADKIEAKQVQLLIFNLLGGVSLLIFGINMMGEGLQKAAGERMRDILGRITGKPYYGVLVGAGVTALIQSSSATTVIVVGFVNARLMTLVQAIGVIIGANIGTTVTGQLIAFKLTDYALPILAVGFGLHFFTKRRVIKNIGQFLLGFGILFLGLNLMKDGVHFLRDHPSISQLFENFSNFPLLGVFVGMTMTAVLQSSSATIGIVIAMVAGGLLNLEQAVPIILGDNIGTCITAMLASIGTNRNARRAAIAHVMFNVIGTVVILILLKPYIALISQTAIAPERQAANSHTIFNILNTLVFLPFVPLYAKLIERIIPGEDRDRRQPLFLDKRLLMTPAVALDQAVKELARMAGFVALSLRSIEKAMRLGKLGSLSDIEEDEEIVDELQNQITAYVVEISERAIPVFVSEKIPSLLHSVNDIERIGDLCLDLVKILEEKEYHKAEFSPKAADEMGTLQDLVVNTVEEAQRALAYGNKDIARIVLANEEKIDKLADGMRDNHIQRLCNGGCLVHAGVFFLEMVNLYENIGNRCHNVAMAVIEHLGEREHGDKHKEHS